MIIHVCTRQLPLREATRRTVFLLPALLHRSLAISAWKIEHGDISVCFVNVLLLYIYMRYVLCFFVMGKPRRNELFKQDPVGRYKDVLSSICYHALATAQG